MKLKHPSDVTSSTSSCNTSGQDNSMDKDRSNRQSTRDGSILNHLRGSGKTHLGIPDNNNAAPLQVSTRKAQAKDMTLSASCSPAITGKKKGELQ